mgnify:CR=1 FL=1
MRLRNAVLWATAALILAWLAAVTWQTRVCRGTGGQFTILGWRCLMPKPSIILRRDLERS